MQVPVWTKPALWGVVVGGVGIAIVGFSQFGGRSRTAQVISAETR
jgi:hypothetical protein